MGNCQGKKATVEAVVSPQKGLDVNTPMTENPAQQVTEAATPDPSPATSPTKTVIPEEAATEEEPKNIMETMSEEPAETVLPVVLDNLSGDIAELETPKSGIGSTSRDVSSTFGGVSEDATEVETVYGRDREANGGFMDKIENFRDACCAPSTTPADNGARGIGIDDDNNEDVIDTNPSDSEDMLNTAPSAVRDRSTISNASSAALKFTTTSEDEADETEASSDAIEAVRSPSNFSRARSAVSRNRSTNSVASDSNYKEKRKLNKKLREIEAIEGKDQDELTEDQMDKLATKKSVLQSLAELE